MPGPFALLLIFITVLPQSGQEEKRRYLNMRKQRRLSERHCQSMKRLKAAIQKRREGPRRKNLIHFQTEEALRVGGGIGVPTGCAGDVGVNTGDGRSGLECKGGKGRIGPAQDNGVVAGLNV